MIGTADLLANDSSDRMTHKDLAKARETGGLTQARSKTIDVPKPQHSNSKDQVPWLENPRADKINEQNKKIVLQETLTVLRRKLKREKSQL